LVAVSGYGGSEDAVRTGESVIAYHGTRDLAAILVDSLRPWPNAFCGGHICFARTPEMARIFGIVLEVDLDGLPVEWDHGEGRVHRDVPAERILAIVPGGEKVWDPAWEDPALRVNHSACLRIAA
jgi:hypothetical protein